VSAAELRGLYRVLAGLLRPGGLFLDGDHLRLDETQNPALARLDRAIEEAEDRRRFPDGHAGHAEDWGQWWPASPRPARSGSAAPIASWSPSGSLPVWSTGGALFRVGWWTRHSGS
jgi:hypothetical protein